MSRARPLTLPCGTTHWFDTNKNGEKATAEQLELLATVETDCDLDDLLDQPLTQGEIVKRLRQALGHDPIPDEVLLRRQKWREQRQEQPKCRKCGREGDSTKHHFVNKWILRELEHYTTKWADRSKNCIPVCIDCHRDLHSRDNGAQSIADCLTDDEKRFADKALSALAEERPKLLILIARGDDSVYEARLIKDWIEGKFMVEEPETSSRPHLAVLRGGAE
jgi:hypothetical protein